MWTQHSARSATRLKSLSHDEDDQGVSARGTGGTGGPQYKLQGFSSGKVQAETYRSRREHPATHTHTPMGKGQGEGMVPGERNSTCKGPEQGEKSTRRSHREKQKPEQRALLLRPRSWGFLLGQWVTAGDKQGGCRALEKLPWLWVAAGLEARHWRQEDPPGGYGQERGRRWN